jgi:hypothetical protein
MWKMRFKLAVEVKEKVIKLIPEDEISGGTYFLMKFKPNSVVIYPKAK